MRDPVEAYFAQLRDIHNSGAAVAEISYYGPLEALLSEVGKHLKPKVRAFMQLKNTGSGNPDGGLFTQQQFKTLEASEDPLTGQLPARGAIEVKGTGDNALAIAQSEQVARYVERYGLVLVTTLRDFALVGRAADGNGIQTLESLRLSETEAGFWTKVQHPQTFAHEAGEGLTEFLRRVLLHNAPLSDPKDVAWFLASYARTARLRLEQRHELPALDALRGQLEDSLGLKFEGEKGDHFFRSTLVQTLFYGMFASWVLWAKEREHTQVIDWRDRFQWETATATLHVPMVYELFRQFADVRQLGQLGISEVLEWAEEVLWRIDRVSFFEKFHEDHAVQYFYEPFLEAFDPQLRKELGVWYTPDEVVKYMVARVDWALREELGIADGLADPSVVILDPCCGTGAYLVEVLRKIDETLHAKGADALTRQDVKRAAMERVIGFEIMPAPFVVAHLQLGLLLADMGVPLRDAEERAAVYLTNALTGWGDVAAAPPKDKRVHPDQLHSTLLFPEFAEERDAADRVKREEQILVVIGNPPYNGFAGVAVDEERELSNAYRNTKRAPKPQGQGLNDLYVRFFRMAERRIVEHSRRGIVCLISNNAWLDSLSTTGMRERLVESFERIYVDNLHGDKYKTGKLTPSGQPDPSVFSTAKNRAGIQVGAAVALLVHRAGDGDCVQYDEFWGVSKLQDLSRIADSPNQTRYTPLHPVPELGMQFCPREVDEHFLDWPQLPSLMPTFFPGVVTSRDDLVVNIDRDALEARMALYFDSAVGDETIAKLSRTAMAAASRFDPVATRRRLQTRGIVETSFVRYWYRPMDVRWIYWEPETKLIHEKVRQYHQHLLPQNRFLFTTKRTRRTTIEPASVVPVLADLNALDSGASGFPMYRVQQAGTLSHPHDSLSPNLSAPAATYLGDLGADAPSLFMHVAAILNSSAYRSENAGGLRDAWPRIPLPAGSATLMSSAALGIRVAELQDVEQDMLSCAPARFGVLAGVKPLDPSIDLAVTARWGIAGKGGVTMPSTGKVTERDYTPDERSAIAEAAEERGLTTEQAIELLGKSCFDVYLNDVAYWRCVPANVWRYTIGGYQVIKKWLSYREKALLGRDLKPEEARYFTEMVRRISALVLMQPELDANYERVKADVWAWGAGG